MAASIENLCVQIFSPQDDFFAIRINSLQAIHVRTIRNPLYVVTFLDQESSLGKRRLFSLFEIVLSLNVTKYVRD